MRGTLPPLEGVGVSHLSEMASRGPRILCNCIKLPVHRLGPGGQLARFKFFEQAHPAVGFQYFHALLGHGTALGGQLLAQRLLSWFAGEKIGGKSAEIGPFERATLQIVAGGLACRAKLRKGCCEAMLLGEETDEVVAFA